MTDAFSLSGKHSSDGLLTATVSGAFTTKKETIEYVDRFVPSVDIITTKSFQVLPNSGNREPIICSPLTGSFGNSVGLRNPGIDAAVSELSSIRKNGMRALLNVSLSASSPEDFITLITKAEPYCDMIELNFSCPHAAAGYGSSIGSDIHIASEYVRKIKKAVGNMGVPLIIKLTPNVENPDDIAEAVIDEGADGIAAINTYGPFIYTDESGFAILNNGVGGRGGASGEWIFEKALDCVSRIRKRIGEKPIIIGMGGVTRSEDAFRMKEAGADAVGIGSALSRIDPSDMEEYFLRIKNGGDVNTILSDRNELEYSKRMILERIEADDMVLITVEGSLDAAAGTFVFLRIPGVGEKPFSVALNEPLKFLVRKRGVFTNALFSLNKYDYVYIRGPYGKPMSHTKTRKAVLVAGGTGSAVLPLVAVALKNEGTEMDIRIGIRNEGSDLLGEELSKYGRYTAVPDRGIPGRVIDTLTEDDFSGDTALYAVGPGIMMTKCAQKAEKAGLSGDRIHLSVEKNTMCGVGLCGECVCGGKLSCKEGTFRTWAEIKEAGVSL